MVSVGGRCFVGKAGRTVFASQEGQARTTPGQTISPMCFEERPPQPRAFRHEAGAPFRGASSLRRIQTRSLSRGEAQRPVTVLVRRFVRLSGPGSRLRGSGQEPSSAGSFMQAVAMLIWCGLHCAEAKGDGGDTRRSVSSAVLGSLNGGWNEVGFGCSGGRGATGEQADMERGAV